MKRICSVLLVLCLICSGATAFAAQERLEPVVIKAAWNAAPGDAVGVYGAHFQQEGLDTQVLFFPLTDSEECTETFGYMRILSMDDGIIQAEIPQDAPKDAYMCYVRVGTTYSKPFFINTPEVDWLSEAELCAGQTVRAFGRNFLNPKTENPADTSVYLAETGTENYIEASVKTVTDYTVDFVVPDGVVPGRQYIAKITTSASAYAACVLEEQEQVLCMPDTQFSAVKEQFGIELGWAGQLNCGLVWNVKEQSGAAGDGVTDDSKAVQNAVAAVKEAGGGILYFPKGTYNLEQLTAGITIPDKSVLVGDGAEQTCLLLNKPISAAANYSGIAKLRIQSDLKRPEGDTRRLIAGYVGSLISATGGNVHFFLKNMELYAADGSSIAGYENKQIVIEDSRFDITHQGPMVQGSTIYANTKWRFLNNYVRNTQRSMIWIGGHSWVDGNTFEGANGGENCEKNENGQVSTMEHRISEMWGDKIYYGNNHVTGTIGDQRPGHDDNSGEGVCNQATCIIALEPVQEATDTTLSAALDFDMIQAGEDSFAGRKGRYLIGAKVAVCSGKGLGQIRYITAASGGTVTIDRPWDVVPEPGDMFTIDASIAERYIIVNNQIDAKTRKGGIMFYNKSYDNIIDHNTLTNSGGIWFGKTQAASQKRSTIAYFNYVANNQLSGGIMEKEGGSRDGALLIGTGDDGGSAITSDQAFQTTSQFANLYRDNTIAGNGKEKTPKSSYNALFVKYNGFVVSTPDSNGSKYPLVRGLILDGNTVHNSVNGVSLSNTADRTLLYKNDFSDNGTAYNDYFSKNTTLVDVDGTIGTLSNDAVYDLVSQSGETTTSRYYNNAVVQIGEKRLMYTAGSEGLTVFDVTDPAAPSIIQTVSGLISQYCQGIAVQNGYLYYVVNGTAKAVYRYRINSDGTIPQTPEKTISGTFTGFSMTGRYLILSKSNGADIYNAETMEKLAALAQGYTVRSVAVEELGDGRARLYYISQTPYSETVNGETCTCDETFHIAILEDKTLTYVFAGKPAGGPWPGFGTYSGLSGLGAKWGVLTALGNGVVQIDTESADFSNYTITVDTNGAVPEIVQVHANDSAVRKERQIAGAHFAALHANGTIDIYDYSNPSERKQIMPTQIGTVRGGRDLIFFGNKLYVMSDYGYCIYRVDMEDKLFAGRLISENNKIGYGQTEYRFYADMEYFGTDTAFLIAEYTDGGKLESVAKTSPQSDGKTVSAVYQPFGTVENGVLKVFLWNRQQPLTEAAVFR